MRERWFLMAVLASIGWAQGGSNYSVIGVGDVRPSVGAFYDGAASLAVALPSEHAISTVNPALWSFARGTFLQGGYRFHQQRITGNAGTRAQNNGKVEGVLLVFAPDTARGWSASLGFYPLSSVNAAVSLPLGIHAAEDTLSGHYTVVSSGGISVFHLGLAVRPLPVLGLGAALRYHFGLFRTDRIVALYDQWSAPDTLSITDWLTGIGFVLGAWYRPAPGWLIGVAFSTPARIATQQEWRYSFGHTYGDTTLARQLSWQLPALIAAGVSYQRGRTAVAVEFGFSDFSQLGYRQALQAVFQPLYRLSASVLRIARSSGRTYWEQLGLAAGVSWQRLYYRVNGHSIAEMAAALGVGFPLGRSALFEVACQTGIRGRAASNLVREWFGRFTFSLSLRDQWFIPGRQGSER